MTQLRLIAGGVLVAALVAFGAYFDHVRDKASRYEAARLELNEARERHAAYVGAVEADRAARDQAEGEYVHEIATLRAAASARPVPAVRVCDARAADPVMPAGEGAAAAAGSAAAAAGLLPAGAAANTRVSRDIGPDLERLASAADELSARYRAALAYWEGAPDG